MTEVVLQLPVDASEDHLFGRFLDRFMQSRSTEVERLAASSDAPYVMIHSDPALGTEVKIVTFQEPGAASAFSTGWQNVRLSGTSS
jgi:hypothetical protein